MAERKRRKKEPTGFRTIPERNGLIEHRVSKKHDTEGRRIVLRVYAYSYDECRDLMAAKLQEFKKHGGVRAGKGATVATWLTEWLERKSPDVAIATFKQYESAVRLHIVPHLGQTKLDDLRVSTVDQWLRALAAAGVGGRARQYVRMVFGNALNDAMRLELLDRNVVSLVRAPVHRAEKFEAWEIDEAAAFLDAASTCRYAAFWTLWLTTGARPHELLGLRPEDVDLDAGTVTIAKQLRRGGSDRTRLKTESSRRTLRITPDAVDALRAHRERMFAEGLRGAPWLFPAAPMRNRAGKVIRDQEPRATDYRNLIADHFDAIVARARVVRDGEELPLKRIRPYDLRHTSATLQLLAGVPITVVSEGLGHESIELTLSTYAKVLPSMREEHVAKVQQIFGRPKTA